MRIAVLGPLEVVAKGVTIAALARRPAEILASLCLGHGEVVSTDRLIDVLWGEDPPRGARNAVQVHVAALRRAIGVHRGAIESVRGGYRLAEEVWTDVAAFDELWVSANVSEAVRDRAPAVEGALSLWRGDPVADLVAVGFDHPRIVELQERYLSLVELHADLELRAGRPQQVIASLGRLVLEHPYREGMAIRLGTALYQTGRQTEALRTVQHIERRLRRDLGVEPTAAMTALERAILRHDPNLDTIGGDSARLSAHGSVIALVVARFDAPFAVASCGSRGARERRRTSGRGDRNLRCRRV